MIAAALPVGITPLVRIPGHDFDIAARLLDAGALGIICPQVDTAEQAQAMVAACKFPPLGHRSVAGAGAACNITSRRRSARPTRRAMPSTLVHPDAGNAAASRTPTRSPRCPASTSLLIGSNDLSAALGIPGDLKHAKIRAAFETTAMACKQHGKCLGVGGVRGDDALTADLVKLGARFVIAGLDTGYLMQAAKADVAAFRKATAP